MKTNRTLQIIISAFALALAVGMLSGCANQTVTDDTQTENRKYMSEVSRITDDLGSRLESFTDAVTRDDLVSMKTQVDNASKNIKELEDLEAPEDLKDIKKEYVAGCKDLKEALADYVELYTEIANATEEAPFDYATYDDRLKDIQELYDSGLSHLEKGDELATEKS